MRPVYLIACVGFICLLSPASAQVPSIPQPDSIFLEELTWMEVRDAIAGGKTTVIIPTGGTEQNGPHMALGNAGTHDTSSLMYMNPSMLRFDRMGREKQEMGKGTSVTQPRPRPCSAAVFSRCRSMMPSSRFRGYA
jgi:hypothetical protein